MVINVRDDFTNVGDFFINVRDDLTNVDAEFGYAAKQLPEAVVKK